MHSKCWSQWPRDSHHVITCSLVQLPKYMCNLQAHFQHKSFIKHVVLILVQTWCHYVFAAELAAFEQQFSHRHVAKCLEWPRRSQRASRVLAGVPIGRLQFACCSAEHTSLTMSKHLLPLHMCRYMYYVDASWPIHMIVCMARVSVKMDCVPLEQPSSHWSALFNIVLHFLPHIPHILQTLKDCWQSITRDCSVTVLLIRRK